MANRLRAAGVGFGATGEALNWEFRESTLDAGVRTMVKGLATKPVVLDPRFHKVGIGVAKSGANGKYLVVDFTD